MKNVSSLLFFCLFLLSSCSSKLKMIEVDCSNLSSMLTQIYQDDQEIRDVEDLSTIDFDEMRRIDKINVGKVVSIIEQCGMPNSADVGEKGVEAIFLVIQHAKLMYQKKYYPLFEQLVEKGDLKASLLALMKDRILVNEGKPQIYGTQVKLDFDTNVASLHELLDPETVDQRRKAVGLGPLKEYLLSQGVEFNEMQIE